LSYFLQKLSGILREIFESRNSSCDMLFIFYSQNKSFWQFISYRKIALAYQVIDHALKSHGTSVIWGINPINSVFLQFPILFSKYCPSSSTKDLHMRSSFLA